MTCVLSGYTIAVDGALWALYLKNQSVVTAVCLQMKIWLARTHREQGAGVCVTLVFEPVHSG